MPSSLKAIDIIKNTPVDVEEEKIIDIIEENN